MTLACQGLGVTTSRAIAIGEAFLLDRGRPAVTPSTIAPDAVEEELARLSAAVEAVRQSLVGIRQQIPQSTARDVTEFIDTHLLMLDDIALIEASRTLIRDQLCNAQWALQVQRDRLIETFDLMDDPYLRTRRDDIEHIVQHIQDFLTGAPQPADMLAEGLHNRVIVARDLTPAEAIMLHHRGAAAYVTECGSPMSHMAILSRSLNVPAVLGVHHATSYLMPGEILIVDSETGTVLADVDDTTLAHYRRRLIALERRRAHLRSLAGEPSVTRDGTTVELLANLELPEDVEAARACGAMGVGLYRTEFLYMNRTDLPDEEEHLAVYSEVIRGLDGLPITIRTLDLGADKQINRDTDGSATCNPALGLRAIRLCLKEPGLFRPQLRAILRAAVLGPVSLMIPMITSVHEVDLVLQLIAQIKEELRQDGLAFDPNAPIGGMIEVPAAALAAATIAKRLDFLSIGTNDLIQYTLAIDRGNDAVSYLYDPSHPAILHLIRMVIDAGRRHQTPVSMCGEMAGDPRFTRLLLGLGLRAFSMQPDSLLEIKELIRCCDAHALASEVDTLFNRLDDGDPGQMIDRLNGQMSMPPMSSRQSGVSIATDWGG